MAYDEILADRIRKALDGQRGWSERRMFGGLAFLRNGRMCCGIAGRRLMVRVGPEAYERTLSVPHVRPMDFTGRPLRGFVYVDPEGTKTLVAVRKWIARSAAAPPAARPKSARAVR
jgi:hypothetical protein